MSRGRVRLQRLIGAPATIVFQYLTNIERTPEWESGVKKVVQMTRGPLRSGVILRTTLVIDGESVHFDDEVTDFEPPSRFGLRSVLGSTNVANYFLTEDDSGRTVVDAALSYDLPDPPTEESLGAGGIRATIETSLAQALELMRDIIERENAVDHSAP